MTTAPWNVATPSPCTGPRVATRSRRRAARTARVTGVLTACLLAVAIAAGRSEAASKCAGSKLKAAAKSASCLVKLDAKEAKTGVPPDPSRIQTCRDKLHLAFAKAEAKPPCVTAGDATDVQTRIDAFAADLDAALSVGIPSKCQSAKLKAAGKGAQCLLRLAAKEAKTGTAADPLKLQKCRDKLAAAYAKAESKPPCATVGDAPAIQAAVDALLADVEPALTAPGGLVPFQHVVIDAGLGGFLDNKSVGDVDGDGLPDVIIGTDTQLVWYEAPGWTKHVIAPGANFTTDMQAADVDGDGDVDVVVPEYDIGRIEWYRNPRIGGGAWTPITIGAGVTAHDVEVADMNGDARIDVVIRGHFGPTTLYLQDASDPTSWTPVGITAAIDNEGTALADVDLDGHVDIVQNGYWLEAPDDPSDGGAWTRWSFESDWEASTVGVAVADLSMDGRPDVVLAFGESPGRMAWYEAPPDPRVGGAWIEHPIADPVDYVHTFKIADVDGDGLLDVVFAEMAQSAQKRVGFFRNTGGGLGWALQGLSTNGSHNVRVADIGADGDLDVVGANWQGPPVELWENLTVP